MAAGASPPPRRYHRQHMSSRSRCSHHSNHHHSSSRSSSTSNSSFWAGQVASLGYDYGEAWQGQADGSGEGSRSKGGNTPAATLALCRGRSWCCAMMICVTCCHRFHQLCVLPSGQLLVHPALYVHRLQLVSWPTAWLLCQWWCWCAVEGRRHVWHSCCASSRAAARHIVV